MPGRKVDAVTTEIPQATTGPPSRESAQSDRALLSGACDGGPLTERSVQPNIWVVEKAEFELADANGNTVRVAAQGTPFSPVHVGLGVVLVGTVAGGLAWLTHSLGASTDASLATLAGAGVLGLGMIVLGIFRGPRRL